MADEVRDIRQRGWSWFDNAVIDHFGPIVGAYAIAIYMALVRHSDQETQTCYPSQESLAKELKISRATVKRSITALCQCGLIRKRIRVSKAGEHQSNVYTLINTWGGVYRDLPHNNRNVDVTDNQNGVGSIGTEGGGGVGSIGTDVGSIGTDVGSIGATNNTHLTILTEQIKDPPTPHIEPVAVKPKPPASGKRTKGAAVEIDYTQYPSFCELWAMAVIRPAKSKGDKQEALKYWKVHRLETNPPLLNRVLDAYAYQKTSTEWQKDGGQYVKQLQLWIRDRLWEGVEVPDGFDRSHAVSGESYLMKMAKDLEAQDQAERERRRAAE